MNGDLAPIQPLDLPGVDVDTDNVVAGVGQAGSRYQTDVSGTKNCDLHGGQRNGWVKRPQASEACLG
jgi:hypothetical protein